MLLPRLSWIARMEPRLEGPPTVKMAFTRVLSELSVYAPGRCALPTTNTWIERSWPMVTSSSKLRKLRDTALRLLLKLLELLELLELLRGELALVDDGRRRRRRDRSGLLARCGARRAGGAGGGHGHDAGVVLPLLRVLAEGSGRKPEQDQPG